ncbi:galactose-1-phosphate uridylyltransferase [Pseudonocardia sp. K10HN5]|uniref:Galactose-1-phosphate uridylyltransferase n=2 Tax=Pseudonocardia acidicola TaxID=2724939 RepID=A0ABX1SLJ0_9PSEU|nr:galactose-1-phosphate uridylyltransferase [Pseudonocardia acidicola]
MHPTVTGTTPARGVRKTSIRLADGRELIYFDDREPFLSGTATRSEIDTRSLPVMHTRSDVRYDVLTGEWVVLAAHRMNRTYQPPSEENPLAPTRPGRPPTEIPAPDYDVVVFENRFPSFSQPPAGTVDDTTADPAESFVDGEPLWPRRRTGGRCEVVCFTSDPAASFAELSQRRARTVIEAWADRTRSLSAMPSTRQVVCFENRGEEIGVTLSHPHGQIYAYPYLPPRTQSLIRQSRLHREKTGRLLLADVLDAERRAGSRMVLTGEHWSGYVPAAARWPLEVHLAPHRDVADLAALDDAEADELATVYLELLRRVDRFFPGVHRTPYIAAWHQAPVGADRDLGRLHLQLFSLMRSPGRMKFLAGSESALGAWINDSTPEDIARRLRDVAS